MGRSLPTRLPLQLSLPFVTLVLYLTILWLAGGASKADALGQAVVRGAAVLALACAILFGPKPVIAGARPVVYLLLGALGLALAQIVPLPPGIWQAMPGRELFIEAAAATGQAQPWRPWAIVPGAAANAAASLIVPITALVLLLQLTPDERDRLPALLLLLIAGSAILGLLQFSSGSFDNPLIAGRAGQVAGTFANRNHFALFLALGVLVAPVWAFRKGRDARWRGLAALGLVLLYAMTILASGSRAGLALGLLALGLATVIVRQEMRQRLVQYPRWAFTAFTAGAISLIAISVLTSVAADRAASIERILFLDTQTDMRARALPTIVRMIGTYFPVGSGLGGFDPIFRIHEPFALLKLGYFNRAHNDFLEIVLDAGLPGLILLLASVAWWASASAGAWRPDSSSRNTLPKLGSTMLLLVMLASLVDYPARTPMIMTIIILAGVWLGDRVAPRGGSALPKFGQRL